MLAISSNLSKMIIFIFAIRVEFYSTGPGVIDIANEKRNIEANIVIVLIKIESIDRSVYEFYFNQLRCCNNNQKKLLISLFARNSSPRLLPVVSQSPFSFLHQLLELLLPLAPKNQFFAF